MGLDLHHAGNEFGVHAIARSGRDHQVVKGRLIGGSWLCGRRLGNRRKHFFRLDLLDIRGLDIDPTALQLQAIFVAHELVAGDVQAFSAA